MFIYSGPRVEADHQGSVPALSSFETLDKGRRFYGNALASLYYLDLAEHLKVDFFLGGNNNRHKCYTHSSVIVILVLWLSFMLRKNAKPSSLCWFLILPSLIIVGFKF
jgi:hypothetical protein